MTEANDDKSTLPVAMKRCSKCRLPRPRSEAFFPMVLRASNRRACLHSACRVCATWYSRRMRARRIATTPEREREKERLYRERRAADPERHAIATVYAREWLRALRGTPEQRYRIGDDSQMLKVPSAPVREAVERSGLTLGAIARMAGRDREGVKRSLAAESMTASCAKVVLEALDLSPVEVGL